MGNIKKLSQSQLLFSLGKVKGWFKGIGLENIFRNF